jgi:hypothetical protein
VSLIENTVVSESDRTRSKSIALVESMLNQDYNSVNATEKENAFSRTEYGLTHNSGSRIKLSDRGDIVCRTPGGSGLLISEKYNSILLNSRFVAINSQFLQMKLRPDGFRLNGYYLNPECLSSAKIALKTSTGTKDVSLFLPIEDDGEFDALLKELKIL